MTNGRTDVRSRLLRCTLGVAATLVLAACGMASAHETANGGPAVAEAGSGQAVMDVDDYLPDADLAQLSTASDIVVYGRVVKTEPGVQIGEDKNAGYTIYTLDAGEMLSGNRAGTIEVAMLTHIEQSEVRLEGRPTPQVGDAGVWFLTAIAPEFGRDGYVLTNQQGLLLVDDGGARLVGGRESSPLAAEVKALGSNVGAVLERLRSVSK